VTFKDLKCLSRNTTEAILLFSHIGSTTIIIIIWYELTEKAKAYLAHETEYGTTL
jgi:hypothetical protein